ncbi:MAG: Adenylate kinase, partial [uncultured Acetobacteraceae bacterium]
EPHSARSARRGERHAGQAPGGQAQPPADLDGRHAPRRGQGGERDRPPGQGRDGPRRTRPRRDHHLHAGAAGGRGLLRRRRVHPRRLPAHGAPSGGPGRHAGAQEHAAAPRHRVAGGRRGAGGADLRAFHLRQVRRGLPRPLQTPGRRGHLRQLRLPRVRTPVRRQRRNGPREAGGLPPPNGAVAALLRRERPAPRGGRDGGDGRRDRATRNGHRRPPGARGWNGTGAGL